MISEHSIISSGASLGANVSIGPFSIIHADVVIGDNVTIGSGCELGVKNSFCDDSPLIIGDNAIIRSQSILYASSSIGSNCTTGHRVTIREKSQIGSDVQVGTLCDIQGHCHIGNFVKMHSNVHVGQKSIIKDFVWLFPYVVLTNDPHPPSSALIGCEIDEFAVIAAMSTVLPGIKIGKDALIGAGSIVNKNVDNERIFIGNPGRDVGHVSRVKHKNNSLISAYPWRSHFHRGYPQELVEQWLAEL